MGHLGGVAVVVVAVHYAFSSAFFVLHLRHVRRNLGGRQWNLEA